MFWLEMQLQHAKKAVSSPNVSFVVLNLNKVEVEVDVDSPGLVDFAIGLVIFVLNLPDGQVLFFFWKFELQKDCNQSC